MARRMRSWTRAGLREPPLKRIRSGAWGLPLQGLPDRVAVMFQKPAQVARHRRLGLVRQAEFADALTFGSGGQALGVFPGGRTPPARFFPPPPDAVRPPACRRSACWPTPIRVILRDSAALSRRASLACRHWWQRFFQRSAFNAPCPDPQAAFQVPCQGQVDVVAPPGSGDRPPRCAQCAGCLRPSRRVMWVKSVVPPPTSHTRISSLGWDILLPSGFRAESASCRRRPGALRSG